MEIGPTLQEHQMVTMESNCTSEFDRTLRAQEVLLGVHAHRHEKFINHYMDKRKQALELTAEKTDEIISGTTEHI